jgi:hypothetical protein
MHSFAEISGGAATSYLRSDSDIDEFALRLVSGFEAQFDRFPDICQRLVAGSALRDAPRKHRALGNKPAVFAWS